MAPKKSNAAGGKKKKDDFDEDAFLAEQLKAASAEKEKLVAAKKVAEKAKQEKAKEDEAKRVAEERELAKAIAQMPPIVVEEVAAKLHELNGGEKSQIHNMCWLAYVLNNFLMLCVETKRKILIKKDSTELVKSFEVHDLDEEEGSPHSWNVLHTSTGATYAIDLTLRQFMPSGKFGYTRDEKEDAPAFAAVKAPSRLIARGKTEIHTGVIAMDGGVLPIDGTTSVAAGVKPGTRKTYLAFLAAAQNGRFHGMSASEKKSADIIFRAKAASTLRDFDENLYKAFFAVPAAAPEAAAATATA